MTLFHRIQATFFQFSSLVIACFWLDKSKYAQIVFVYDFVCNGITPRKEKAHGVWVSVNTRQSGLDALIIKDEFNT